MNKPVVAITMGDPAGIGPEIVVRALEEPEARECCHPIVIGDPAVFDRAVHLLGSRLRMTTTAETGSDVVNVVPAGELPGGTLVPGTVDPRYGESAAACCRLAVEMARAGEVRAIVSTPFNKESFHMAGIAALDDMAYFQQCFGGPDRSYMVGEVAGLWVTTVTYHVPFRSIADLITVESVLGTIAGLHRVMQSGGVAPLRIGVAGLNVHSGEGGMFGREEIDVIEPAIRNARAAGYDAVGPVPPDSLFFKALQGAYRGLVCMYHDQANIGRKILGRDHPGVTLYMGMPTPVFTVPHGTAFDIAWQGKARHAMLARAIRMAAAMEIGCPAR